MSAAGVQTCNQVNSGEKIHACQRNFSRTVRFCCEYYLNWCVQDKKISNNQPKRVDKIRVMLPLDI